MVAEPAVLLTLPVLPRRGVPWPRRGWPARVHDWQFGRRAS